MSALYERSQLTQVMISSAPATAETMDKAEYLRLDCTIKEVQFTAGQKQDIDVTTLCSTEQENINGLGASSEISMSGNFYLNQAQNALRDAYDNDALYAFKVLFPSGKGFKFLAEVRQHTVIRYQRRGGSNVFTAYERQTGVLCGTAGVCEKSG